MARLPIELPDRLDYATEIRVRVTDLNYANHLGNDALVSLLHEARTRFLGHHGLHELDIEGLGIVIGDLGIVYTAEAHHGDVLRIEMGIGDFSKAGCDIYYRITRARDEVLVARAKTGIVFIDRKARRAVRVPESFRGRFSPS
ncbi:MAG: thioesterase family protein [Desulfobacteraceae bacterium]|jgi:acyl-CoA thioesterase FadM